MENILFTVFNEFSQLIKLNSHLSPKRLKIVSNLLDYYNGSFIIGGFSAYIAKLSSTFEDINILIPFRYINYLNLFY